MIHRPESDEEPSARFDADSAAGPPAPVPPLGPVPARFPTPELPRTRHTPAPASDPIPLADPDLAVPAPVRASAPVPGRSAASFPSTDARAASLPVDERELTAGVGERTGHRRRRGFFGVAAALLVLVAGTAVAVPLLTGNSRQPDPAPPVLVRPTEPIPRDVTPDDLRTRKDDPEPLTAKEVFPARDVVVDSGGTAYRVLKTHSSASCGVAATGEISSLLDRLGCNQVVRGTLRTPDGGYLITAGLFNLTDRAGAEQARDRIKSLVDSRKGRLQGMSAGRGTEAVARSSARVGWQAQGHYLAYCVVARADGASIRSGDQTTRNILNDLLEGHLRQGVLARRARTATTPTGE